MKVSRSTGYGLLAMGFIASRKDKGIVLSDDIAKEYNIPLEYLLKILQQMVRVNILRSKRGPRGGFSMAKPANKITMLEIMEAVEGPMAGTLGLDEHAPKNKFALKTEKVNEKIIEQTRAAYGKIKLSDLLKA